MVLINSNTNQIINIFYFIKFLIVWSTFTTKTGIRKISFNQNLLEIFSKFKINNLALCFKVCYTFTT